MVRRSKDKGISTAYYEAVAQTYEEAREKAFKGIRLSEREVRFKESGTTPEGVKVRAISTRTRVEEAKRDLRVFLDGLGINADISGHEEEGLIFLDADGPGMGLIIGRGGSTLESIEYLLNIIHNRRFTPQMHIILDIGGYRKRDIQYIDSLLNRAIQHISYRGKPYNLPPMSSKKRKLTHLLIRRYPGYVSQSVGEEPRRRVEVRLSSENPEEYEKPVTEVEDESSFLEPEENTGREVQQWNVDDEGSPLY